ncbi:MULTISPECIES: tRNA adenosine(34) deaminase TadA [unclassified Polaromonas]|uniref:tRNA adenosine(34) deaminase TadA n=1 Tax=unclassified Polaromonas TaxID=2638319 RepID=UPI0018C98C2D|nr:MULTISPECIES: tRNA adenosine(34) deaminase TadA [unclassified Polaromonas]MBG6073636.1 tRNA(adenine34) deaminase [Polaromonas sp. CG_9.7]MBG6115585.1 tRNA(adenine34) deaminase [Polaromonas sp. CG_9.2]MDH6185038.1 tRNA(adenine34) deaminase [Polaromonas sp. CG_23.6]
MNDADFMKMALEQARIAASSGEVPVGAVIVRLKQVIARGRNSLISGNDPTAHAEIVALRAAAKILGNYRLNECELFVTLEPCAMCSGAILNARLKRVVFGASEPKTGAAGSVINLFAQSSLNHKTECQGGVLADASRGLMQDFFRQRRFEKRASELRRHPLRDDALRTPDAVFDDLPDYPWISNYRSDLCALGGLRIHYLDEQMASFVKDPERKPITYLCLHNIPGWSYEFRKIIPQLLQSGDRVVVPDLIGCGKSDKPKKSIFHTFARHRQILLELVEALDLSNIVLVFPERQGLMGLTLPMSEPKRYRGLKAINLAGEFSEKVHFMCEGIALWKLATCRQVDHDLIYPHKLKNTESSYSSKEKEESFSILQNYHVASLSLSDLMRSQNSENHLQILQESERFWSFQNLS